MKAAIRILLSAATLLLLMMCSGKSSDSDSADHLSVIRFDSILFEQINTPNLNKQQQINEQYPEMIDVLDKALFKTGSPGSPTFWNKLIKYYQEPTLHALYADALRTFSDISVLEQTLGQAFSRLQEAIPNMQRPTCYMHVSGLRQNTLVAEGLLSISVDKYLGEDYSLYKEFFYEYQLKKMTPQQVSIDYITAWILSEFPFEGRSSVLLDRMIYEGKVKYLVRLALPEIPEEKLMGYSSEEYQWCKTHEAGVWKDIIKQKHLYTPDMIATKKYFEEQPTNTTTGEIPGNLGTWIGWQIVNQYMIKTNSSLEILLNNHEAQQILNQSKYKPR